MPPIIVDQPWPPDVGEDLRRPSGQPVIDPTTGRPLRVYHDQHLIWATFTPGGPSPPPPGAALFPILIDSGFNETFLMQERQARAWMGTAFAGFQTAGRWFQMGHELIPAWAISLWAYPNVPGTRDPDVLRPPTRLRLPGGVPLTPPGSAYAKEKPLLGLRAIRFNKLTLRIDGGRERLWLDAP